MSREQFTADSYRTHLDQLGLDSNGVVDNKDDAHGVALTANTYLTLATQAERTRQHLESDVPLNREDLDRIGRSALLTTERLSDIEKTLNRTARMYRRAAEAIQNPITEDPSVLRPEL